MKYILDVAVDGRIKVEVEANSFEEAKNLVHIGMGSTDWNNMEIITVDCISAKDENGKLEYC